MTRSMPLSPAEFSLLFDPRWAARAFTSPDRPEEKNDTLTEGLCWIRERIVNTERINHALYLRRESMRMRATSDLDTLCALLLGRIEFRYTPDHPLVQTVFERIYHHVAHSLWEIALRDYLTLGVGGVALSPLGVQPIRPELACAYPNWHRPRWSARVVPIHYETARNLFPNPIWARVRAEHAPESSNTSRPRRVQRDPLIDQDDVCPILEVMHADRIEYYYSGQRIGERRREARYGHFLIVGEERTLHTMEGLIPDSSLGYRAFREAYEQTKRDYYYRSEHDPAWLDFPIGTIERAVRTRYRGYNLYEAHEKVTEALMKEVLKGRYALYQFDIFDEDSEVFHEFEEIYNAIGYNSPEPTTKPPITFLGGINLPEIQIGLREIEGLLTTITGVNPYMLGQVGVTKVASEVVAMTQQTNLKLQQFHEAVARTLEPFIRAFQLYLIQLPRENQTLIVEPYDREDGARYAIIGNATDAMRENPFYQQVADFYDYEQLFSQTRIELAYTGHVSLMERRQNYMQALQLLGSMMQVLMQTGQVYQLAPLVDRILRDLGVDVNALKPAPTPTPTPTPTPAASGSTLPPELDAILGASAPLPLGASPTEPPVSIPPLSELDLSERLLSDPEMIEAIHGAGDYHGIGDSDNTV